MQTYQTFASQFEAFCAEHSFKNMRQAFDFFTIFGGLAGARFDTAKPLEEAVEESILKKYPLLYKKASDYTANNQALHALLGGVALGDGRIHSAYKRARTQPREGARGVEKLLDSGIVTLASSEPLFKNWIEGEERISDKLYFISPFFRFWFGFIAPIFTGIKAGEFGEFYERYANYKSEFVHHIFVMLSHALLQKTFQSTDAITQVREYWDAKQTFDVYAKTASGKVIAGVCRTKDAKLKKDELTKLQAKCKEARMQVDIFVIFSLGGFSKELKEMSSESVMLFGVNQLGALCES